LLTQQPTLHSAHVPSDDLELWRALVAGTDLGLVPVFDEFSFDYQNNASGTLDRSRFGFFIFCTMCGYGGLSHTHRTTRPSSSRIPYLVIFEPAWSGFIETHLALPAEPDTLKDGDLVRRRSDAALLAVDALVRAVAALIALAVAAFHFSASIAISDTARLS